MSIKALKEFSIGLKNFQKNKAVPKYENQRNAMPKDSEQNLNEAPSAHYGKIQVQSVQPIQEVTFPNIH